MTTSNIQPHDLLQVPAVISERYMLIPIEQGFDWHNCFASINQGEWYLVVFRSKHRDEADIDFLNWLDEKATEAAQQTQGFLHYFTGTPLTTGECLSFCLWKDRHSAIQGTSNIAHNTARQLGSTSYEYYQLERYYIRKQQNKLTFMRLEFGHSHDHGKEHMTHL